MKIAFVSEDGVTISQHFGRAPYYIVLTVENGQVTAREQRPKMGHQQFANQSHDAEHEQDPRGHGFGPASQDRHALMAQAIADCDVMVARGMGTGVYYSMEQANIRPVVTDAVTIDQAVQAYLAGNLNDHTERLH
jgi:predicted Fe-Mo cluster-binding NifX family protein